jgi:phosphonopyruvate decarboxylase
MMIDPVRLLRTCKEQGITFFTGVPDSLLKDFCACVSDNVEEERHIIAANEGNAIGLATGWFLGTGELAMVYMQNSGIGNSVNPLMSLADPEVYSIPMLVLVGWRGMKGSADEPQHVKQGRITPDLLNAMEIPFFILDEDDHGSRSTIIEACTTIRKRMAPAVVLVKPGTFKVYEMKRGSCENHLLSREEALKYVVGALDADDITVSTTGKTSRELYEYRVATHEGHGRDFMTVGSMGHASSIAMALALARHDRRVVCLDGDGAVIMHMGSLAVIGQLGPENVFHVVFNNGAHDSVGGQPTVGLGVDMTTLAKACGYKNAFSASTKEDIIDAIRHFRGRGGPSFLEVIVCVGGRPDLGRPKTSPIENRNAFMKNLDVKRRW